MEINDVRLTKKGRFSVITFNRPKAYNAVNFELLEGLVKSFEICADDHETRAIVITGEGKAFCAGGDVALFGASSDLSETTRQMTKLLNFAITGIRRVPKPVIAMINGAVFGVGISIAAACDLRICASSAKFKQAYTSLGLAPDGAWTLLVPLLIGFNRASELIYMDPLFDAQRAFEIGLVTQVVPDDELERATEDLARRLAEGPAAAYSIVKGNFNNALFGLLERQLELERKGILLASKTSDAKEGIASVIEKRKASFTGK